MATRQLPSGKPPVSSPSSTPSSTPPTRPIFVAGNPDKNNIIDAEIHVVTPQPDTSPWAQPTATHGAIRTDHGPVAPHPTSPFAAMPPHPAAFRSRPSTHVESPRFVTPSAADLNAFDMAEPVDESTHRISTKIFGIECNPWGANGLEVIIRGSKWVLTLLFLALILVGFSLEKVPEFLPQLLEIIF